MGRGPPLAFHLDALGADVAGVADDEADAVEGAVLEVVQLSPIKGGVEAQGAVEQGRLDAQFPVVGGLGLEDPVLTKDGPCRRRS